jgi:hypothetical protein
MAPALAGILGVALAGTADGQVPTPAAPVALPPAVPLLPLDRLGPRGPGPENTPQTPTDPGLSSRPPALAGPPGTAAPAAASPAAPTGRGDANSVSGPPISPVPNPTDSFLSPPAAGVTGPPGPAAPFLREVIGHSSDPTAEGGLPVLAAPVSGPGATGPCPPSGGPAQTVLERLGTYYKGGFVLVDSPDPDRVPFRLVARNFAQVRFTNTQLDSLTFVDHLGGVRPVDPRNDISFNRDLLVLSGYALDPKMQYNVVIWSSGSLASVVVAGGLTYQFSESFNLSGGYNGLPGSRSLIGNFKDLAGIDRSLADTFFRPGFTQGVWATGEPADGLYYNVMVGNSLNTLQIGAGKIDANLAYSGSVWWEPLGSYGPAEAYNDFEKHADPVIRLGTSLTRAREDRFTDSSKTAPDNIQIHNSDGTLFFETGSLAPGVTVLLADYTMWALDAGVKYEGLALNGQYYFRWLNNFRADGPVPQSSTFDHGFEASAGYFVIPQTCELYARTSYVFGAFRDSHEFCGGFNWYPLENRGVRVVGEVGRVEHSPVGNIITPYRAGQSGWMYLLQAQLDF